MKRRKRNLKNNTLEATPNPGLRRGFLLFTKKGVDKGRNHLHTDKTQTQEVVKMDKLAINKRTALKMFWDAGATTEELLVSASKTLDKLPQPSEGYWYANDVAKAVENFTKGVGKTESHT